MLKSISTLGTVLNTTEQKTIHGGDYLLGDDDCPFGQCRNFFGRCSMFCD
jgi:hypothetical protein